MKKIIDSCIANAINWGFGVFFLLMCGYIATPQYKFWHAGGFYFTPYKVLLFAVLIVGVFLLGSKISRKEKTLLFLKKNSTAMLASVLGSLFVVQIFIMYASATPIGFDCGIVVDLATKELTENSMGYVMSYPNNLTIVLMLKVWWKLTGSWLFADIWLSSIALNIIFVDIGILLVCKTAQKLFEHTGLYTALFLAVPVLGLSPYILVPYSDTMAIPFLAGFIYAIVSFQQSQGKKKALFACEASFLLIFGYTVKPTVFIVGIACFGIAVILVSCYKASWKKVGLYGCCFVVGLSVLLGLNMVKYSIAPKEAWQNRGTPMTHFIMMGLKNGGYDEDDVNFTASYHTKTEKQQANLQVIRERLIARWNEGTLVSFLLDKGTRSFIDGTFFYGGEGYFHQGQEKSQEGLTGFLQNVTYVETEFYQNWYCNYLQAWWLMIAALLASYLVQSPRKVHLNLVSMLQLSILGLWIFLMIFECRSRYVLHFMPVVLILAIIRIIQIDRFIAERKKCNEQHH